MDYPLDQDGHLIDHTIWNTDVAQQLANSLNITLTPWHIDILNGVRLFYAQYGHSPSTRPLIKFLNKTVDQDLTNANLQHAFNTGLVARHVCRLAGIPKPANCL